MKNDKNIEKNLNNFFGIDEKDMKKVGNSPNISMKETNYSQFIKIQREMDDIKNKLKNGKYNPITNQSYF